MAQAWLRSVPLSLALSMTHLQSRKIFQFLDADTAHSLVDALTGLFQDGNARERPAGPRGDRKFVHACCTGLFQGGAGVSGAAPRGTPRGWVASDGVTPFGTMAPLQCYTPDLRAHIMTLHLRITHPITYLIL